ncbi:hypothetical protein RHMOL_Rhmol03G0150100 [Rhododendron molle]|uniref:Uncharacterized protein n=1 Tax=Rhododendron molle TaxID=49168 RepID=A0ACC0PEW3_RHOML|nr:hypothetical protein RHMOL_Rhmol03G0150100 [Rhododendron molle]
MVLFSTFIAAQIQFLLQSLDESNSDSVVFRELCQLSLYEKVRVGLSLADSENVAIRTNGQNFCMGQIDQLLRSSAVLESAEQIQNVLMFLDRSEGLSKHVDPFMQILYLMEPKGRTPLIFSPLQTHDTVDARNMDLFYGCRENEFDAILVEMVSETNMSSIMSELGYGCTVDASHCNEVLSLFLPLTEATLSRILGTIARMHTGLVVNQNYCSTFYASIGGSAAYDLSCLSSWNIDVLMDSIKQLAPDTNWIHVMENLDHEGFYLPSGQAFSLFMSIYHRASQSVWTNVEGQFSFLRYAVSAPPEACTFAHSTRKLTPYNLLQYEVLSAVFPIIVGYATGSSIVLQLWQSNPKLVLQGFLDIMKTDQGNMVKVLDICQELKALDTNAVHITSEKLSEEMKRFCKASTDVGLRNSDSTTPDECSDDIEAEANTYFREIFSVQMTSDAMVEMLARFWESSERRLLISLIIWYLLKGAIDFERVIQKLSEECCLFPRYPERKLNTTAVLVDVRASLRPKGNDGHNLQRSQEDMQDDSSDEYYMIGSQSLLMVSLQKENSVSRAVTSPAFVHSSKKITSTSTLRQNSHTMGFGSALNIETLVAAAERRNTSMEYPASSTQDKILFMINNMSSSNIEAKAKEFSELLSEQHYPLFAQYMVMKRHMRKGLMIIVIPFTSKVLFKNLGVDMKVVKPTSLLKDRARESEGNPDFSMKDKGASQPQLITGTNTGIMSTSNAVDLKPDIISSTQPGAHLNLVTVFSYLLWWQLSSPIHEIGSHIIFNQKLSALGLQYFERSVPLAIKRAIEEVMGHVVQHNVTIATQTTKDLVLKDYAMESDETPIYNAAHLMIASLAGSLAHVTCKASNISSELQEQAVAIIMNDNLDLCCAVTSMLQQTTYVSMLQ